MATFNTGFAPTPSRGMTAAQMFNRGLSGDVWGMSNNDLDYNFDFLNDSGRASRNVLRGLGFDTSTDNPYEAYMENQMPGLARLSSAAATLNSNGRGGTMGMLENMQQRLAGGFGSGGFNSNDANGLIYGLKNLQSQYGSDPTQLTQAQRVLAQQLSDDPSEAMNLYSQAHLSSMSPLLRNAALLRRTNDAMLDRYKNAASANPNLTALQFLTGGA